MESITPFQIMSMKIFPIATMLRLRGDIYFVTTMKMAYVDVGGKSPFTQADSQPAPTD
jgi:hypothetical protein